jgi:hypothetical protein
MHLVSNEALGLVDEMNALPKTVFEVVFMAFGYGDSIGDAEHGRIIPASRRVRVGFPQVDEEPGRFPPQMAVPFRAEAG